MIARGLTESRGSSSSPCSAWLRCGSCTRRLGPEEGGEILGWRLIPRTSDRAMPHTWEMWQRLFDPEVRGRDTPIWRAILGYSWYTFRMALVGLLLGGIFGVALAVVMARFKVIERGLLPYVIASQTIPLIALAPQVAAFGGNWDLPKWMWVSTLGAFLAFFPIAVATLKGLSSAPAASLELMDSYAASWWSTLRQAASSRPRSRRWCPASSWPRPRR